MEILADEGCEKTNPNKANFQRNDEDYERAKEL